MSELEAVQIIGINKAQELTFNRSALCKILLHNKIKDKPICVVSIAGIYRSGKSFLLNFLLRYLKIKYQYNFNSVSSKEWLLEDNHSDLNGFHWKNGSVRDTEGILIWPEVFLANLPNSREQIAIILLDTQGSFDNQTTMNDNAAIFALSTLISSVQIYNLKENIKDYDLDHLHLFSDYGRLIDEFGSTSLFQELIFLIRDWSCPYEHKYGFKGGSDYIENLLESAEDDVDEIKKRKSNIKELFSTIRCFLMPHPGIQVASTQNFKGELEQIDEIFKEQVQDFAFDLLAPKNLKPKLINGTKITSGELFSLICGYWNCFKSGKLPQLYSLFEVTCRSQHLAAIEKSFNIYKEYMKYFMGNTARTWNVLNALHKAAEDKAFNCYDSTIKLRNQQIYDEFRTQLKEKIEQGFWTFKEINKAALERQEMIYFQNARRNRTVIMQDDSWCLIL